MLLIKKKKINQNEQIQSLLIFYRATSQFFFLLHSDLIKFICSFLKNFYTGKRGCVIQRLTPLFHSFPSLKMQTARKKCKISHGIREEFCFLSNTERWWELGVLVVVFVWGFVLVFK